MKLAELHKHVQAINRAVEQLLIGLETEMSETEIRVREAREHAESIEPKSPTPQSVVRQQVVVKK